MLHHWRKSVSIDYQIPKSLRLSYTNKNSKMHPSALKSVRFLLRHPTLKLFSNTTTSHNLTNVDYTGGVKRISMCDLKSRNSLSIAMMENLIRNINEDAQNRELRVIILKAEGPIFSAGHNMRELTPESGKEQHEKVFRLGSALMNSIIDCPVPVIAQVDGVAAAAGCQLVAQCDLVVCTEKSTFSTPGVNFGIFCSTPGIPLARRMLRSTVSKMLYTGLPITAKEAKESGLVTAVCPPEDLEKEVEALCGAIMTKSRSVIELGKRFFYRQMDADIRSAYELGADVMVENINMKDGQEGVKSFVEKRKPVWSN